MRSKTENIESKSLHIFLEWRAQVSISITGKHLFHVLSIFSFCSFCQFWYRFFSWRTETRNFIWVQFGFGSGLVVFLKFPAIRSPLLCCINFFNVGDFKTIIFILHFIRDVTRWKPPLSHSITLYLNPPSPAKCDVIFEWSLIWIRYWVLLELNLVILVKNK